MDVPIGGDGILEVLTTGPDTAVPLLFNIGSPAAAAWFGPLAADADRRGLRLVSYSRPGFGRSTRRVGRRVADSARDITAVLDALDAERFFTIGWSGGGPSALAAAVLLPTRCLAIACVSSIAPMDATGLEWFAGMADDNVAEYSTAALGADALTPLLEAQLPTYANFQAAEFAPGLTKRTDLDQQEVAEFREFVPSAFRRAMLAGIGGWLDDDLSFAAPWGFDPAAVGCPATVWHGAEDTAIPPAHGRWLAERMPGARMHIEPLSGHAVLFLARHTQIVDELVALAG